MAKVNGQVATEQHFKRGLLQPAGNGHRTSVAVAGSHAMRNFANVRVWAEVDFRKAVSQQLRSTLRHNRRRDSNGSKTSQSHRRGFVFPTSVVLLCEPWECQKYTASIRFEMD